MSRDCTMDVNVDIRSKNGVLFFIWNTYRREVNVDIRSKNSVLFFIWNTYRREVRNSCIPYDLPTYPLYNHTIPIGKRRYLSSYILYFGCRRRHTCKNQYFTTSPTGASRLYPVYYECHRAHTFNSMRYTNREEKIPFLIHTVLWMST